MTDTESAALIGHTGFVGSNLLRQRPFEAVFNSSNIDEIRGRGFDLLVVAGARAEKWKANAEPERDLDNIERLARALQQVKARRVVLISTVDVFLNPVDVDETSETPMSGLHAYGRHRRRLEQIVSSRFNALVVRLPALYGPGLKKNIIYDLLHDNDIHKIDSRGTFQFYNLDRLWSDVSVALQHELQLVHLPTEPVSVADVARGAFAIEFTNEIAATPARYDMRTRHGELFGGSEHYIENKTQVLAGLSEFVARERASRG
jgi:nucleoside-diphosphate-sugar epimerase